MCNVGTGFLADRHHSMCHEVPSRLMFGMAQAVVRGWRDRRWVLHHITIPAILACGLHAKHTLQTSR